MLHTFAHRINARVKGLQSVVDDDALLAIDAGGFSQGHIRFDADRHHDEIGGDFSAIGKAHRLDVQFAQQRLGVRLQPEFDADAFHGLFEQIGGRPVQLAVHQISGMVGHGYVHALLRQAIGSLQSQ